MLGKQPFFRVKIELFTLKLRPNLRKRIYFGENSTFYRKTKTFDRKIQALFIITLQSMTNFYGKRLNFYRKIHYFLGNFP